MKKVKIMLTVILVVGTVGGVLAIKAKRIVPFCTTAAVGGVCPNPCDKPLNGRFASGPLRCYTTTFLTSRCSIEKPACDPIPAQLIVD